MTGSVQIGKPIHLVRNLLVLFSGFYITKLPISPIYWTFGVAVLLYLILILLGQRLYSHHLSVVIFGCLAYFSVSQVVVGGQVNTTVNVLMSLTYFFLSLQMLGGEEATVMKRLSVRFVRASIALLVVEVFLRISNPAFDSINYNRPDVESILFYAYKYNSIMYLDSNFVGLFIVALFFFCEYLTGEFRSPLKVEKGLLFLLSIGTISRASIATIIIFACANRLYCRFRRNRNLFIMAAPVVAAVGAAVLVYVIGLVQSDESFLSKFELFRLTSVYLRTASAGQLLFGVGFGNAIDAIDMGAHNFILTYLIESGIIGLTAVLALWGATAVATRGKVLVVMGPVLFNSMSVTAHAIPYIYVMYSIIYLRYHWSLPRTVPQGCCHEV